MRKLLVILLFFTSWVYAQNFSIQVSTTKAQVNERVAIQYTFDKGNLPENLLPNITGMLTVGGPSLMTGSSTINGVTTSNSQLTYEVIFNKPGNYTIPAATVKNKYGKFTSKSISIQVVKGANTQPIIPPGYEGKELMIVMQANKKTVYIGEPVAIDLIVYCIFGNVTLLDIKYPSFDGGWTKDATDAFNTQLELSSYKGKPYNKWAFKRVWIIPSILGKTEFKPVKAYFHAAAKHPTAGYLEFSFNSSSEPVIFDVLEVPAEKKPVSFVNAVGDFSWSVKLDKTQAKANEPIKAEVIVTGAGNLPTLEAPILNLPDDFEAFEPKVTINEKVEIKGINGTKKFEYLIMPRKEGDFVIPPFSFSYFNPGTKKYTELYSDSFNVSIKGIIADTTSKINVVNNGKFTGEAVYKKKDPFFGHPIYYILLALPFLVALLFIFFRKKIFFTVKDHSVKIHKQAEEKANKELPEAKDSIDKLSLVFYQYLSDKFKTNRNQITRANINQWITDEKLKTTAIKILDQLDQFRFAPAAQSDLNSLYNHIKTLIDELGKK